ncbi:MAG: hypothetical protein HRT72_08515 [Flavobacteriales bacterium]|nr:hypothetical protein [Flavobacteriales bacterium]
MEFYRDKKVLIVGAGNSGCDLACELVRVAKTVGLSMRSGNYIIPKYLLGKPADSLNFAIKLPVRLKQYIHSSFLNAISGQMQQFGLPKPLHNIYEKHPIINSELKYQIGHGHIKIQDQLIKYDGNSVLFSNEVRVKYDAIILATGFNLCFPFIDKKHLNMNEDCPELFLNIFNKDRKNLFVMGMISSLGLGWDGRYKQALLVGRYLRARINASKSAKSFEDLMKQIPDLSGGYNYKFKGNSRYYVNNISYMRLLEKGLKMLAYD